MLAGTLVVSASPAAQADGDYCGHRVLGDIEKWYLAMGGPEGSLGCPLTEELVDLTESAAGRSVPCHRAWTDRH